MQKKKKKKKKKEKTENMWIKTMKPEKSWRIEWKLGKSNCSREEVAQTDRKMTTMQKKRKKLKTPRGNSRKKKPALAELADGPTIHRAMLQRPWPRLPSRPGPLDEGHSQCCRRSYCH
jgi:hypothetical protein